jgi:hypothetical protein
LTRSPVAYCIRFNHACLLRNDIYPEGFINETLQTLTLLFPPGDKKTQRWYANKVEPEDFDHALVQCGVMQRRIGEYRYWRDRLVILKEAFDESQPSNFTQWWNDRRDGIQWYTLWVAIGLTLFFGLVQSVEGGLQLYKAYYPTPS